MTLKDINLNESQQKELKDKLDSWKAAERKKIEEELTERYEQMEAELKEESESQVEEIKEHMKKVYSKRFSKALKEMYSEIRAEVMVESMKSPEAKALEEVKATVYPLINESTVKRHRDEFAKLAQMYEGTLEELELLKGQRKKLQLTESLSPEVKKVVFKLLGEGTEEEMVERFAEIKKALKEEASATPKSRIVEDDDDDDDDWEEETDEDDEITIQRSVREPETNDDSDDDMEEDNNNSEFANYLNEQLTLAGLKKSR